MSEQKEVAKWFKERLSALTRELDEVLGRRAELDARIKELKAEIAAGKKFLQTQLQETDDDTRKAVAYLFSTLSRYGDPSGPDTLREAATRVLSEAGGPMHAKDIWAKLEERGMTSQSDKPVNTVVSVLSRNKSTFDHVGPNTFGLKTEDRAANRD